MLIGPVDGSELSVSLCHLQVRLNAVHDSAGCFAAQVVPTIYTNIRNQTVSTNQYSVSEYFKSSDVSAGSNLPGIFCFFDLSPIKARALTELSL
jgi:hypothetical protein